MWSLAQTPLAALACRRTWRTQRARARPEVKMDAVISRCRLAACQASSGSAPARPRRPLHASSQRLVSARNEMLRTSTALALPKPGRMVRRHRRQPGKMLCCYAMSSLHHFMPWQWQLQAALFRAWVKEEPPHKVAATGHMGVQKALRLCSQPSSAQRN